MEAGWFFLTIRAPRILRPAASPLGLHGLADHLLGVGLTDLPLRLSRSPPTARPPRSLVSWLPGGGWASGGALVGLFTGDEHPSGGEYCTHITDIRMSLCTIARRLCLSKPSSGRRLSVVWGHLYSTEVASEKVVDLADRIAALPPEEIKQIAPALLFRLNREPPQVISGQGFSFGAQGGSGAGAGKAEEKKAEKTVFDVKLEKFDAAAKIKIIKEIRTFTDLGLKEAKELVEKAPVILKQSLTKEEAEAIIGKIKAAGGVAVME